MKESTKRTVTIFTIAFSLVPCLLVLTLPQTMAVAAITLWASAVVGYMGIVLLLWMYILGTKSVMGLVFRDLAPVLAIHKWLGKYGVIAMVVHPLLITISYGETWFYSLVPQTATVAERHILLGQIALLLLMIVWVSSALLRGRLAYRPWKYIHYLAYVCIPFALLHVPDLGSQEQTHQIVKAYLFVLALAFVGFSILRLRSWLNLDRTQYIVTKHVRLTELDYMLQLTSATSHYLAPRRGQYIYLKLGILSEDHPFSVTQYNEETRELTVAYRMSGMFTKEMKQLAPNQTVYLSGPYGSFTEPLQQSTSTPVVYLAGGIGITPFVDRILREERSGEQWLFAANRTRELAVLFSPLKKRLGSNAVAVYNTDDSDLLPGEERGYITADLLKKYIAEPTRYDYYLCGPPAMMNAMRSVVTSLGVASGRIHTEEFGW